MEITKEELIDLIKNTVNEMNVKKEINEEIREIQDEIVENSCGEKKEEVVENSCEEKQEEVKNEETVSAPDKETKVNETEEKKDDTEEKKDEVIKIESLNSAPAPTISKEPEWKNLHGKAFFDWYAKHPNGI